MAEPGLLMSGPGSWKPKFPQLEKGMLILGTGVARGVALLSGQTVL